jgi:hypothetical protein
MTRARYPEQECGTAGLRAAIQDRLDRGLSPYPEPLRDQPRRPSSIERRRVAATCDQAGGPLCVTTPADVGVGLGDVECEAMDPNREATPLDLRIFAVLNFPDDQRAPTTVCLDPAAAGAGWSP